MPLTWQLSATEMAHAIRRGDLSSREAVDASLERIAATERVSNAFDDLFEDARDAADQADRVRSRGASLGPLHGVPVALKANHDVAGRSTTSGVRAFVGSPPAEASSPVVERLREAGAILVGRTRMPPGGFRWSTESAEYGPTRNPWDPAVTAGASSGGAGVAVAVGAVPLAIGNDIGGSIRYPAAMNGILGLRPTVNRVPAWLLAQPGMGVPNAAREYCVDGPMARTADDLLLALEIISQPDVRDPFAINFDRPYDPTRKPKVGVVRGAETLYSSRNTSEVDAALSAAASALASSGYEVVEVELPALCEAATLWWQLALVELDESGYSHYMRQFAGDTGNTVWSHVLQIASEAFDRQTLSSAYAAMTRRSLLRRQVSEFMADVPILLTAASGESAFTLGDDALTVERSRELVCHQWMNLALPLLGLPAVGMATMRRAGAAPLGVQIVGRTFAEKQVLDVARDLSEASPVRTPVEPIRP